MQSFSISDVCYCASLDSRPFLDRCDEHSVAPETVLKNCVVVFDDIALFSQLQLEMQLCQEVLVPLEVLCYMFESDGLVVFSAFNLLVRLQKSFVTLSFPDTAKLAEFFVS